MTEVSAPLNTAEGEEDSLVLITIMTDYEDPCSTTISDIAQSV